MRAAAHRTLRDVTEDYEGFRFNTMVAKLMELSNTLFRYRGTPVAGGAAWDEAIRLLLLMLAPAAPHITEEIWSRRAADAGREWTSIHTESWPEVDVAATAEATREVPIQVNGKLRDKLTVRGRPDRAGPRGRRPGQPEDRRHPGRKDARQGHPGRRRQAREHRPARGLRRLRQARHVLVAVLLLRSSSQAAVCSRGPARRSTSTTSRIRLSPSM